MFIEPERPPTQGAAEAKLMVGLILAPDAAPSSVRFKHLQDVLTEHGATVRWVPLPSEPSAAPHGATNEHCDSGVDSGVGGNSRAVTDPGNPAPAGLDVVLVDLTGQAGLGPLAMIDDHPLLKGVPVVVMVDRADHPGVEQYVRYGIADLVLPSVGIDELMHRLHVISARMKKLATDEVIAEVLRSKVRSVSAALAACPENSDTAALSRIFIEGLAHAFDADRVHLELFDEKRTGLFTGQWPLNSAAQTPVPDSTATFSLARTLWEGPRISLLRSPPSTNDDQGPIGIASLTGQGAAACFTVAVPIGEGEKVSGLVRIINDTGALPWTEVHTSLLHHVAGNFLHALHQAKVHARNTEAIERLTYLNFLKDDFVATINHEFRSPLATITGHLEMVADGLLGPIADETRTTLEIVLRNTGRLNNLVENILTVSALDHPHPEPEPVNMTDVASTVITSFRAAAATKNILLTTNLPDDPITVAGHSGQLEEALRNILRNSLDYTPTRGSIALTLTLGASPSPGAPMSTTTGNRAFGHETPGDTTASTGSRHVLITVQDTGIGIPESDLPHLYTSFYRGSNVKHTTAPGSGLGLTITKQILDRHAGTIIITSTLDQGTRTLIKLPLAGTE